MTRLEELPETNTSQITLISILLLDVLLRLKSTSLSDHEKEMLDIEVHSLLDEPKVIQCLRPLKKKVYDLISGIGDENNWLFFAKLMNDGDSIIDFLIKRNRMKEALEVLCSESTSSQLNQLLIKYGYFFFKSHPKETVSLLKKNRFLEGLSIIPCLIQGNNCLEERLMRHLIVWLEDYVIRDNNSIALNYLLLLYAEFEPKKLSSALDKYCTASNVLSFESVFLLDSCLKKNLKNNTVKILESMSMIEDAVKEAIVSSENVLLAQNIVKKSTLDSPKKKKLWKTIGKSILSSNELKDVSKFVSDSTSTDLALNDILPLLPDFFKIDFFKNDICNALLHYSDCLQNLKEEMSETADNVSQVKQQHNQWRSKSLEVHTWTTCTLCKSHIMSDDFIAFPCLHFLHLKCFNNQSKVKISENNVQDIDCPFCGQDIIDDIDKLLPRSSFDANWT
jgi:hypothetical protein